MSKIKNLFDNAMKESMCCLYVNKNNVYVKRRLKNIFLDNVSLKQNVKIFDNVSIDCIEKLANKQLKKVR